MTYQRAYPADGFVTYIGKRMFNALIVFFLLTIIIFFSINLLQPSPVLTGNYNPDPALLQQIRHDLVIDKPIVVRYLQWIGNVFRGNLGTTAYDYSSDFK